MTGGGGKLLLGGGGSGNPANWWLTRLFPRMAPPEAAPGAAVPCPLADAWHGEEARAAARSAMEGGGADMRVCFRNFGTRALVVCWVDEKGRPHHFYSLEPTGEAPGADITDRDHIEHTHVGHAFVVASAPNDRDLRAVRKSKRLAGAALVGGVRGKQEGLLLVEIHPRPEPPEAATAGCCGAFLRGSASKKKKKADENDTAATAVEVDVEYDMVVTEGKVDPTPLDTTGKEYVATTLGGWPVRLDAALKKSDKRLRPLARDLEVLCRRLPPHAKIMLQETAPLWINDTYRYGPRACPVEAMACCFHPDVEWLRENGCSPDKAECVELYNLDEYNASRDHWLDGGVMLHEYSHAYHYKCLEGRYDNAEIRACYDGAMRDGLYDSVGVHGSQGPAARAYAATDPMEYFAELSAAFLGGLDPGQEYNKWYPYNRRQVLEHDPRAYELLKKVWQVQDNDNGAN